MKKILPFLLLAPFVTVVICALVCAAVAVSPLVLIFALCSLFVDHQKEKKKKPKSKDLVAEGREIFEKLFPAKMSSNGTGVY